MSKSLEIVLVEGNPNDAELTTRSLRKHHLANNITVLRDGAEAIEFLFGQGAASAKPRVVLLDIKLPKVDGIEVLRRMKADAQTRSIPVIVLASPDQERDMEAVQQLGVTSIMTKPIRFETFTKVVSELGIGLMLWGVPSGGGSA